MPAVTEFKCPACYAAPGEPCHRPTSTGRAPVTWYHLSREALARRAPTNGKKRTR